MDEFSLHVVCYSIFVTAQKINSHLNEKGDDSTLQIEPNHRITPLIPNINSHAPADYVAALLFPLKKKLIFVSINKEEFH